MGRFASRMGVAVPMALLAFACKSIEGPKLAAHSAGTECTVCHAADYQRWSGTLHAASAAAVLTNPEHNSTEQLIDECIGCHAPFEVGRYHVGDFVRPVDTIGPWHVVAANVQAWEGITCVSCHDRSAPEQLAFYDPATHVYQPVKDATELCEKCHQPGTDDSRDLAGSVHAGLQCTDCHFQSGSEHSLSPRDACQRCHPAVNPKHPEVDTLATTYANAASPNNIHFITCASCH